MAYETQYERAKGRKKRYLKWVVILSLSVLMGVVAVRWLSGQEWVDTIFDLAA